MAQVQFDEGKPRLIAAGSVDLPAGDWADPISRDKSVASALRELGRSGNFKGRKIILGLPAAVTQLDRFDLPGSELINAKSRVTAMVAARRGVAEASLLVRHFPVKSDFSSDGTMTSFIVASAARREVDRLLAIAAAARLDVVGMNVECRAIADCYTHVYRRRADTNTTNCLVDIGSSGTRMLAICQGNILDVQGAPIGSRHFDLAVAQKLGISLAEANLRRLQLCHAHRQLDETRDKRQLHCVRAAGTLRDIQKQTRVIDGACASVFGELLNHLREFCARQSQHYPRHPIGRLSFIGGEGNNRSLCRSIARALKLSAIVGDPLLRLARNSAAGFESGIDLRQRQPAWTVAIGLTLGAPPVGDTKPAAAELTRFAREVAR
jgi:Tfp pilus assembly PilM family ATPase